jgi:dihydrofolate reductase
VTINAILARDANGGIGKNNDLPWPRNDADMKWFRENTLGHVVVMGRKTWESLGSKKLPKRINYVITNSNIEGSPDGIYQGDIGNILNDIEKKHAGLKVWVIGGANIYKQSISYCDHLYLTEFKKSFDCDTYLNINLEDRFIKITGNKETKECTFSIWSKK